MMALVFAPLASRGRGVTSLADPSDSTHRSFPGGRRLLEQSARLEHSGPWWRRSVFALVANGNVFARITTKAAYAGGFFSSLFLRQTSVSLSDGTEWRIDTRRGKRRGVENRVVVIHEGEQSVAQNLSVLPDRLWGEHRGEVGGHDEVYVLLPVKKARRGEITSDSDGPLLAVIQRVGWRSRWLITVHQPLPIWVVMLHWHILLGDWVEISDA